MLLSLKINTLGSQVCTNQNVWQATGSDGWADYYRLDVMGGCYLTVAKGSEKKGFSDTHCWYTSDLRSFVNQNADACEQGSNFYIASYPVLYNRNNNAGLGTMCMSNSQHWNKCGRTNRNGATPVNGVHVY
ncbi:hypothetical protein QBC44DRAFT_385931 [Cladorrhinum sp. PSN332]|nr:hypothetical protein QBC44DRAFT_385931 [Cladorrhinum sp. PSN332]